jgi:hypothetical protein
MNISSVRSFLLSYPFPEPIRLPFYGGERTILKRDAMLIRIETDSGLVGYAPRRALLKARCARFWKAAPWPIPMRCVSNLWSGPE